MAHAPANDIPAFARGAINLASARLGAEALFATDDFFAPAARMLDDAPAVFHPDRYDDNGKWMDGWESRRRRGPGHDWAVVRLAARGRVTGFDIDTAHFTGNYPSAARVEGWLGDGHPAEDADWVEIAPFTPLGPDAHHFIPCASDRSFSHVRLHIHPDGGVARFRVYGQPELPEGDAEIDLAGALNGARVIGWSNAHYGDIQRVLYPGRGLTMGAGWETRRLRAPGNDWLIVRLACRGVIARAVVDTRHNKGNYPESCSIQAADMGALGEGLDAMVTTAAMFWDEIVARETLGPDAEHILTVIDPAPVTHVRLNIYPDGGISRLRLFGRRA